jgi:hypothetical protein
MALSQIFELHGGLGNQLFQISAARRILPKPVFDVSMLRPPFLKHLDSSALQLVTEETVDSYQRMGGHLWLAREKVLSLAHGVLRRERVGASLRVTREGYSPALVEEIRNAKEPLRIRGYFQALQYLDFTPQGLGCARIQVEVRNGVQGQMAAGKSWSSVHVRLGDFRDTGSTLGSRYYENAIQLLLEHGAPKDFVLFSDEPASAMKLIDSLKAARWIKVSHAPDNVSPLQTLRLMSEARASIIANSTLSWWGAATNPEAELIVAPKLWGVEMTSPIGLIPDHWKTLENQ